MGNVKDMYMELIQQEKDIRKGTIKVYPCYGLVGNNQNKIHMLSGNRISDFLPAIAKIVDLEESNLELLLESVETVDIIHFNIIDIKEQLIYGTLKVMYPENVTKS